MKSGDNNLDAHRETKTVRDVLSPYQPRCHPGCNPDGKVPAAKLRFRLAIPPHPRRIGSSVGDLTPPADPSLPTTEEGISGRDGKKH